MTATNHALTGATIGFLIGEPLVALPLAFLSHFICDALPHFGSHLPDSVWLKTKTFRRILVSDAALCVILVGVLAYARPSHWLPASLCAFLATSPDLFWINSFIKRLQGKKWAPNLFSRFASGIQWFQRPIGLVVEAAWAIAGITIVTTIIRG